MSRSGTRRLHLTPTSRLIGLSGIVLLAILWTQFATSVGWSLTAGVDNHAYWSAWRGSGLYEPGAGLQEATYLYSPAFAQLIYPLALLPWDLFRALWIAMACASMVWLLWPLGGVLQLAATTFACYFCLEAKADWIIALTLAYGITYPATWSAALLTKLTPGIGLAWFAVRREWRSLGIALGATTAIILGSFAIGPTLWFDWFGVLARSAPYSSHGNFVGLPVPSLLWRLPPAMALIALGARRGWAWTLPVAAILCQPDVWGDTLVILAAIPRLLERPVPALGTVSQQVRTS